MTIGNLTWFKYSIDCFRFFKILNFAVGILYFLQTFLVNVFDPSNCDSTLFGPKTFIFFSCKKSAIPSTKGFSGPTTTNSISFFKIKS